MGDVNYKRQYAYDGNHIHMKEAPDPTGYNPTPADSLDKPMTSKVHYNIIHDDAAVWEIWAPHVLDVEVSLWC